MNTAIENTTERPWQPAILGTTEEPTVENNTYHESFRPRSSPNPGTVPTAKDPGIARQEQLTISEMIDPASGWVPSLLGGIQKGSSFCWWIYKGTRRLWCVSYFLHTMSVRFMYKTPCDPDYSLDTSWGSSASVSSSIIQLLPPALIEVVYVFIKVIILLLWKNILYK
jgi:hypothetical protein